MISEAEQKKHGSLRMSLQHCICVNPGGWMHSIRPLGFKERGNASYLLWGQMGVSHCQSWLDY